MRKIFFIFFAAILGYQANAQKFDINLLDKINSPINEKVDTRWQTISDLNAPICIGAPLTMLITGVIKKDKELRIKSFETGASILLTEIITVSLKRTFKRDRPFITYPDIIHRKAGGKGYSFPSGHTSSAFATATSMSLSFPKWYVIVPSYAYACTIAFSRMYLGVHYPSDLLGGIVIGIGTSFLVFEARKWLK